MSKQKNVMFLSILLLGLNCVHKPERISQWSELDSIPDLQCQTISFFEPDESIKIRFLDIINQGDLLDIKVTHVDRQGRTETRIGQLNPDSTKPIWIWSVFQDTPVYFGPNDYLSLESLELFHYLNGEKILLKKNPERELIKVVQIGDKTLAVRRGDQIEIMSRQMPGAKFETLQTFKEIVDFSQEGQSVKWYEQINDIWWVRGWDPSGLWQTTLGAKKRKVLRIGSTVQVYDILEDKSSSTISLSLNDFKKSWKNQYLMFHEIPGRLVIQRWVDSESVVELLDPGQLKSSVLGVLPENWWVRKSLDSRNTHFLVEGDGKWQICVRE